MRQTLSPAPTPARASPAAYRALCVHSRPYVTVSSKSWKYCWSGESAARRRIISVRVEASLTSSWTIRDSSIVVGGRPPDPPPPTPPNERRGLVNPSAEGRQRRVCFAVSQIEHRDDVPGPAGADQASKIFEPVDGSPAEADDHVAIAQARLRGRCSGEDAREPKTIGPRAGQGDDAEERAAGSAALAPARRRHLRVDRTGIRRQTLDDAYRDGSDASHAGRVDLVRGIGRSVVVLVAPGVEEQDRDAGVVKPGVVGGLVWRALEVGRDPFPLRRLPHERP